MQLTAEQVRVVGALIEKQLTTPQQYPLSVNALIAACNQTTNRDPVVSYSEDTVRDALVGLRDEGLTRTMYATGSRTPKYAHRLDEHFDLAPAQLAIMGLLLLRGPQTVGELRTRSDRAHPFSGLDEVEQTLQSLAEHPYGALVERLERRPGQKEARWRHLIGPAVHAEPGEAPAQASSPAARTGLQALVEEVAALRQEVAQLRAELDALRGPA
jgi:uncharacterized protein